MLRAQHIYLLLKKEEPKSWNSYSCLSPIHELLMTAISILHTDALYQYKKNRSRLWRNLFLQLAAVQYTATAQQTTTTSSAPSGRRRSAGKPMPSRCDPEEFSEAPTKAISKSTMLVFSTDTHYKPITELTLFYSRYTNTLPLPSWNVLRVSHSTPSWY